LSQEILTKSLDNSGDELVINIDTTKSKVAKLRYDKVDDRLSIYLTPETGTLNSQNVSFKQGGSSEFDLIIVLGVPTIDRIDKKLTDTKMLESETPIVNIDFHRSNANYGAVNLIEPTAASLAEILVALAESLQNGLIDEAIATALLTGLVASTDRFTAAHTTSKALTVAAQLMAGGAKQQEIVKNLYKMGKEVSANQKPQNSPSQTNEKD